jgi:hypothetical protein
MPVQLAERRAAPPKKKAFTRAPRDYSQRLRRAFQLSFFGINVWIAVLFLEMYGWAVWTGHWHTNLPDRVYMELVPRANEFSHP